VKRLAALSLLCGIFLLSPGAAQDRKSSRVDPTPIKLDRTSYAVHNADPVILAEVVGVHFRGEATLIAAPAGSGNAILVSGSPAIVPEVVRLLEQLDRRARSVEVEITIAEMPAPKDGKDLTPADLAAVEALVKEGKGQRIKLTSVEGQQVSTQIGGNKPFVSSSNVGGGRGGAFGNPNQFGGGGGGPVMQRSITYHQVGTTVKMTPRIGSENAIALELNLQDSKTRAAEEESSAPSFDSSTLTTKLSIPAGKSVVAQTARTERKAGPTVSVVIVSARVVPPDTGPRKSK